MNLEEKILQQYKDAFKSKDEVTKNILNYVIAQFKNKKIELGKQLDDGEIIAILKKEIKSRLESLEYLKKASKIEDIQIEIHNIEILKKYLPQMMEEKQLQDLIKRQVAYLGITDLKKERGRLIAAIMGEYKSVIDPQMMNEIINKMI